MRLHLPHVQWALGPWAMLKEHWTRESQTLPFVHQDELVRTPGGGLVFNHTK